ncbi:MAG TPA: NAD(P)H-dependent glycerol-3-phosphate dehydrogenase, partial [Aeromicrobium sp.]|nr:NAD(P)H-dependent glycerol-3-phosphate dehydrogenase [Aeromicrobium sp.]
MARVAVMGAGSWGTAFALVLADAGNEVTMWGRRQELCDEISTKHENTDYLPGIALPRVIRATSDPAEALDGADVVVLAVPSQQLRSNLDGWGAHVPAGAPLVSLMKGIELGTHKRMSEVIAELTGAGPDSIAVVTGPNLAKEIAMREPAASVVACEDLAVAEYLQKLCHTGAFRPYTLTDVVGAELGGAVKNVIALAVGVAIGLG